MRPLYIVDLDGTISDPTHRRHLLKPKTDERMDEFYSLCHLDGVHQHVVDTIKCLQQFADVWVWTGRRDDTRDVTLDWLEGDACLSINDDELKMRPYGDRQSDETLKESWLLAMSKDDRERLIAVYEDRSRVVAMWRRNGVPCFQVAPGDF